MSQVKCRSDVMLLVLLMVLLGHLIDAAPPVALESAQSPGFLRRLVRSPAENQAARFQSEVSSNPHLVYLKSTPVDLHINIGEIGSFRMFLTGNVTENVEITFMCRDQEDHDTPKCNTFSLSDLKPVNLTAQESRPEINFTATSNGHDLIMMKTAGNISDEYAFVRIRVGHSYFLTVLGTIFGWIYMFAWSISFWPQNISNYRRKSVVGLNFDYTILHFTGFLFYSIFNLTLFFSAKVQEEYEVQFPHSEIPVELNDVVYSIHAAAVTSITWCQCLVYENGGQRLSVYGKIFQGIAWSIGSVLLVLSIVHVLTWLNFIYYFSYVKLLITGVKYMPQVIFNFRRKSTAGWSILMIYLDITGGSMSMLQMITNSYNYNDYSILVGNLPKLGLSIASICYDIIFLLQHFVFYPNSHCKSAGGDSGASKAQQASRSSVSGGGGSRRSALKEAGDSQEQLFSMNSSLSSLQSSLSSSSRSSSTESDCPPPPPPPGLVLSPGVLFTTNPQGEVSLPSERPSKGPEVEEESEERVPASIPLPRDSEPGKKSPGQMTIDLSSQLDAIRLAVVPKAPPKPTQSDH